MNTDKTHKMLRFRWLIFLVLALSYFFVYFHRLSMSVVADDLGLVVTGSGQEDQCEAAALAVLAGELLQSELVAVEVEGLVDVRDAYHCMEVFHCLAPLPC